MVMQLQVYFRSKVHVCNSMMRPGVVGMCIPGEMETDAGNWLHGWEREREEEDLTSTNFKKSITLRDRETHENNLLRSFDLEAIFHFSHVEIAPKKLTSKHSGCW